MTMTDVRDVIWFVRRSWAYLGCDAGTGRWRARRRYAMGLVPAGCRFVAASRRDRTAALAYRAGRTA